DAGAARRKGNLLASNGGSRAELVEGRQGPDQRDAHAGGVETAGRAQDFGRRITVGKVRHAARDLATRWRRCVAAGRLYAYHAHGRAARGSRLSLPDRRGASSAQDGRAASRRVEGRRPAPHVPRRRDARGGSQGSRAGHSREEESARQIAYSALLM